MSPGDILRDDTMRPVRVAKVICYPNGTGTVLLDRLDRKPREHRQVSRAKEEVDHYPAWKGPLP